MTKREAYEVISSVFSGIDHESKEDVLNLCEKEIAALDHKNEMAKKRAAEKRAQGDALRATIEGLLSDEPKTVNDILAELNDDSITPAKVVSRMTQLVKAEKANKETVKADGRKLVAYTIA